MSDRHTAEKRFADMLQEYREEILPSIADNWNNMTELEQEHLSSMNNFYCGLHYITGLADCTEEVLKLWETEMKEEIKMGSSGTQRLVRTACKAFHHQGSQQCGSYVLFRTYLRKQGIHNIPLACFVGNRFNVVFYHAAGIYYLRKYINEFIETVQGSGANLLLKAVHTNIKNPVYLAGCRALGLVDKIVTGPLWRKLRQSDLSVLGMSSVSCAFNEKFDTWCSDAHEVVTGQALLGEEFVIHTDEVWSELIKPCTTLDVLTQQLLQFFV